MHNILYVQVFKYQHMEINIAAFKIKRKVTEGKSGEFWEAVSTADNSKVVIKYPKVQDKFKLKEITALTKISHPNVIKLIGISTIKSPIALITEYIDNGNLLTFLRSNKNSLKISQQLAIAESIARGMVQLERSNIVHCDLTAHSILIDSHLVCKISSFGNALCLDSTSGSVALPQDVKLLLPLKWCAPEVFLDRKFSTKSDVWSYSVVLYEIFSMGGPPYSGMSNSQVREFVTKGCVMPKPSPSFSSNIYELMQNCFKFVPIDRPAFAHIYKSLKSFHDKKKGGPTRENNTDDDYEAI